MSRKLSESTKKRLFMLLNFLEGCEKKRVTSREIALLLGIKDSLVRYDFVQVGLPAEHRGFRNGYDVKVLEEDIKSALGILGEDGSAQKKRVCVVGLGRLGAAFLDNDFFEKTNAYRIIKTKQWYFENIRCCEKCRDKPCHRKRSD